VKRANYCYRIIGLAGSCIALFVVGCGFGEKSGPVAHWHGQVRIDGQPLPADAEARIFFAPTASSAGRTARPAITEVVDSNYNARDVPIGPVSVTFEIKRPTGRKIPRSTSVPLTEYEDLVPAKHRNGMAIEVKEGEMAHDFEL
jgi:hypothetical protein